MIDPGSEQIQFLFSLANNVSMPTEERITDTIFMETSLNLSSNSTSSSEKDKQLLTDFSDLTQNDIFVQPFCIDEKSSIKGRKHRSSSSLSLHSSKRQRFLKKCIKNIQAIGTKSEHISNSSAEPSSFSKYHDILPPSPAVSLDSGIDVSSECASDMDTPLVLLTSGFSASPSAASPSSSILPPSTPVLNTMLPENSNNFDGNTQSHCIDFVVNDEIETVVVLKPKSPKRFRMRTNKVLIEQILLCDEIPIVNSCSTEQNNNSTFKKEEVRNLGNIFKCVKPCTVRIDKIQLPQKLVCCKHRKLASDKLVSEKMMEGDKKFLAKKNSKFPALSNENHIKSSYDGLELQEQNILRQSSNEHIKQMLCIPKESLINSSLGSDQSQISTIFQKGSLAEREQNNESLVNVDDKLVSPAASCITNKEISLKKGSIADLRSLDIVSDSSNNGSLRDNDKKMETKSVSSCFLPEGMAIRTSKFIMHNDLQPVSEVFGQNQLQGSTVVPSREGRDVENSSSMFFQNIIIQGHLRDTGSMYDNLTIKQTSFLQHHETEPKQCDTQQSQIVMDLLKRTCLSEMSKHGANVSDSCNNEEDNGSCLLNKPNLKVTRRRFKYAK